jgi:hypothetical protein
MYTYMYMQVPTMLYMQALTMLYMQAHYAVHAGPHYAVHAGPHYAVHAGPHYAAHAGAHYAESPITENVTNPRDCQNQGVSLYEGHLCTHKLYNCTTAAVYSSCVVVTVCVACVQIYCIYI